MRNEERVKKYVSEDQKEDQKDISSIFLVAAAPTWEVYDSVAYTQPVEKERSGFVCGTGYFAWGVPLRKFPKPDWLCIM